MAQLVRFKNVENLVNDTHSLVKLTRKQLMKEMCPVFSSFPKIQN